ncbi:MAG: helix-turn-helix domain-containing protein [Candidatus Polarisedimenticolia bacterium]
MASFGEELKRERELRDISLKEISEATKISIRFLEALEQDNYDVLPGGVFNRGFIRAYARFIGVDGEEMVNAYLHEISQREARHAAPTAAAAQPAAEVFRPESRPTPTAPRPKGGADREARGREARGRDIPAERRHIVPSHRPEGVQAVGSPALWWGAGGVIVLLTVVVLVMSLSGARREGRAGGTSSARMARATRTDPPPVPGIASAEGVTPEPVQPTTTTTSENPAGDGSTSTATSAPPEGEAAPPPPIEHVIRVQATEVTRVRMECGPRITLNQELWPGQARTLLCAEPVLLSADNAGAVQYSVDGKPAALLGAMGEKVEAVQVAPPPPPPAPASPDGRP